MASGLQAIFAQGAAALEAGDLPGAEQLFRSIVESDPRAHPAWNALSVVAVRSGQPDLAVERAKQALELDRRNQVYLNSLGVAYGELGRFDDSEEAFRRALKAKPAYAEGVFNLGKVLQKLGRVADAQRAFERAYAMNPSFPGLLAALIAVHRKQGRADLGFALLKQGGGSLAQDDFRMLWLACIRELEGADRALAWMREQRAQHPGAVELHYALGEMLLERAQWREGWSEYFWRPNLLDERSGGEDGKHMPGPLPERLDGAKLLLRAEQGIGDVLFFLRFAPALAARGARLSLYCNLRMAAILDDGVFAEVRSKRDQVPPGEYQEEIRVGDLPARLGAQDTPPPWPLKLRADLREAQRARLAALGPPPYLAVTWRAGTDTLRGREFGNQRNVLMKEVPAVALGAAVRGWPGTVLALQRGLRAGELAAFAQAAHKPAHDFSAVTENLDELTSALSLFDEHVAVSNTNIHLLAGIGRSARVLVPYPPEWRWMLEGRSPWFPDFPVYREPQSRGWDQPLAQLRKDLSL